MGVGAMRSMTSGGSGVRLQFFGATGGVTGSCFLVEGPAARVLVDCGLFQGTKELQERNYGPFPFDPRSIDAVVLTHSHIDHSGLLPKLVRHGFRGAIYATAPTKDLCRIMLADSAHIQESEVERKNRKRQRAGEPLLTPIYTVDDVARCLERFEAVPLRHPQAVAPGITATFYGAGHILGAASVFLQIELPHLAAATSTESPLRLLFSGDIGRSDHPILPAPEAVPGSDFMVMESTYGNRQQVKNERRYEELAQIVEETFARGGNLLIPAFAVERTQDVLYGLNRLIHDGTLTAKQVYVDSPLAAQATEVFCQHVESFNEESQRFAAAVGTCPMYLPNLSFTLTAQDSMALNRIRQGAVIIAGSGMCQAGRIKHHLKHNLWRPECSVVMVGYQAAGTLGRQLVDGAKRVRIHGDPIQVRARIYNLEGFSAHAGQDELVAWAGRVGGPPKTTFLVHGEPEALTVLRDLLVERHHLRVEVPEFGSVFELGQGGRG